MHRAVHFGQHKDKTHAAAQTHEVDPARRSKQHGANRHETDAADPEIDGQAACLIATKLFFMDVAQGLVARANGRDLQVIDLQGRINSNAPDFCMAQCRKHGYRSTQCSELGA